MTAEVAILNQYGVALAADSAVTVQKTRVWQTSNKLFSVHPSCEVGVMIYGSASFQGIPLETIIKDWRHSLINPEFNSVRECANSLVDYIKVVRGTNKWIDFSAASHLVSQLERLGATLRDNVSSQKELNELIVPLSDALIESLQSQEELEDYISWNEFQLEYKSIFSALCERVFGYKIYKKNIVALLKTCWENSKRKVRSSEHTGIVVAGFGKSEVYPESFQFYLDGAYKGLARIWMGDRTGIDLDQSSALLSYAQSDVVECIIEGINGRNSTFVKGLVAGALERRSNDIVEKLIKDKSEQIVEKKIQADINKALQDELSEGYEGYRHSQIVGPILDVIASLPKEELAVMAEALVDITSLVRKVGSPLQTVGGPVDAAVISKGDGFIWIKRKGYFDKENNLGYLTRADISVRRMA